jgi:hypothetical protein
MYFLIRLILNKTWNSFKYKSFVQEIAIINYKLTKKKQSFDIDKATQI